MKHYFFLFFLISSLTAYAQVDHSSFNSLLQKYVSAEGSVDYSGLKDDRSELRSYIELLADTDASKLRSDQERMAYWINFYNAATLELILDNIPLKSILDLDNGKVWDRKWIKSQQGTLSLNDIEHEILRKKYEDPRIHAAVNCASRSCPPLYNRAFKVSTLDADLNKRMSVWINDSFYNKIGPSYAEISEIFNWYGQDFGDIISYLNDFSKVKLASDAKISYLPYDWNLNGN